MNPEQFKIWETQRLRECQIELEKFREDMASRGLALSGFRNKGEQDIIAKCRSEIQIQRLAVKPTPTRGDPSIEGLSDAELLKIIRAAENTDVPGSRFHRAQNEWNIRQQQKILDATKRGGGVFIEAGGDVTNHGVIQTDGGATVNIATAGNYSSNDRTRIIQGDSAPLRMEWYEKPVGQIVLGVTIAVIAAAILYFFGIPN